jgi:hypothetical protein
VARIFLKVFKQRRLIDFFDEPALLVPRTASESRDPAANRLVEWDPRKNSGIEIWVKFDTESPRKFQFHGTVARGKRRLAGFNSMPGGTFRRGFPADSRPAGKKFHGIQVKAARKSTRSSIPICDC